MTHKERILAACRGERADRIPWLPRLDLWHNANARAGTLPERFAGATLRQITDALDLGFHCVVPNFLDVRTPEDTVDRGLGIYRLAQMPFDVRLREVDREVRVDADTTHVIYHTPVGEISCAFTYTKEMKEAGASISWITECAYKSVDDVPALEHIFANLEVLPSPEPFRAWSDWIADACAPIALGGLAASPMHHIMRDLMPMTDFFLELVDHPAALDTLARSLSAYYNDVLSALAQCDADIIFLGANYDETITYPPLFEEHFLPWLSRLAAMANDRGKFLLTHTDGENEGLIDLYRRCGFHIADSFCPSPMTKMTLRDFLTALPDVTVWGGIPSVALCESSMSRDDFDRLLDDTLALAAEHPRLILGIADTTPAGAGLDRILAISERVNALARSPKGG